MPGAGDEASGTIRWRRGQAYFSAGEGTLEVPMTMHRDNRAKLVAALRQRKEVPQDACILLEGGSEIPVYDTDTVWDFKQESNFQYLLGVKEPDCKAAIRVSDGRTVLLIPKLDAAYAAWMGTVKPPAWFQRAYEVDEVRFLEELPAVLSEELGAASLLVLEGTNRDSGEAARAPSLQGLEALPPAGAEANRALWEELAEARVVKSAHELKILQFANDVTSQAHVEVMRSVRAGVREYMAEATFKFNAAILGCPRVGYHCICPSASRNAVLHYGHAAEPNAELVEQGSLTLRDMGAEYHGYTADVTCTYPVSGAFTAEQRAVYEAVWEATLAVERAIRPGVCYKDMHRLAQRTMLAEMTKAGLFRGDVDDMMKVNLMHMFMFHGVGHCLGLDVHDVGGYAPGVNRKDDPSIQENLRCGRELMEGMVITVEPGFYFADFLFEEALADPAKSKFIDRERLQQLRHVGGVRIEDDVVITATGCRVLTNVPRTVAEIEATMAGLPWKFSAATQREYCEATADRGVGAHKQAWGESAL
uniref:Xaa-Pro dipeptidase n=1 Tax=Alexandrium monilatum TaxID=311494 RepID=A0A7S4Q6I9_9DINO|mmetsp:Transcript_76654/g.228474  ORF Transcript_76654/g.228474 Transcript_76654/m.228474 type:complete len:533 (-) Transcript_76654:156-1754(-)